MAKKNPYRFCFGPWNLSEGGDPYGPTTRPAQSFDWKLDALKKLGFGERTQLGTPHQRYRRRLNGVGLFAIGEVQPDKQGQKQEERSVHQ